VTTEKAIPLDPSISGDLAILEQGVEQLLARKKDLTDELANTEGGIALQNRMIGYVRLAQKEK
jgi:hypothetical protein|tara:strand:+ start:114 stop:302 length:189 start_codon:yes stop_codon:yes gene_type:complete